MAYEKNCFTAVGNASHFADAFFLEACVADGENLIDKQNIRLKVGRNGKSEADKHSA